MHFGCIERLVWHLGNAHRSGAHWVLAGWFADELGRPMSGLHASRRFKKFLSEAGLPSMRYHELRHGAVLLMAALGIAPRVTMEILVHARIRTTMNVYSHVAPEFQRDAVDRMGSALWATG
jgi:integrase